VRARRVLNGDFPITAKKTCSTGSGYNRRRECSVVEIQKYLSWSNDVKPHEARKYR
jgi:hypothetical protein